MDALTPTTIESLVLANHVESVNGLLYVSGGGWSVNRRAVSPSGPTPITHLGLALIIAVPWHQTNRLHMLITEFRDEDASVIASVSAQLNVGRPPELRPGTIQYANVGLPMDIVFPHPGDYEINAHIEGIENSERRWTFQVQDIPQPA